MVQKTVASAMATSSSTPAFRRPTSRSTRPYVDDDSKEGAEDGGGRDGGQQQHAAPWRHLSLPMRLPGDVQPLRRASLPA